MNSYLLYKPNSFIRAFTVTPELQFQIFDPRDKIVQNVKFSSVNRNSDSTLQLNPTRLHKSRGMLGFQNIALDIKLFKFHVNWDNRGYVEKNVIFNENSFAKSEITIGFVVSNWICGWSRFLIPILSWTCKQNETKLN